MNSQLKEINEIISLCDCMIKQINEVGIIYTGNHCYEEYKRKIHIFFSTHQCNRPYAPYIILNRFYFNGQYSINMNIAQEIKNAAIRIKHDMYPDLYEKVFISHREKDAAQVAAVVELLHAIGIPRPTVGNAEKSIFCTSHPATYIDNGARNLDEIRNQFNSPDHTFYILWYTDNYFTSQACLNEAGAIWAMNKKYQEILAPDFESTKIGGLMDKQPVWFRANNKYRLNTFKQQIDTMFSLDPLTPNAWEEARDTFIAKIEMLSGGATHANA